ncbi:MAG TPA: serine/threonine-protein kinase [Burkholderiaceae bacterium]
MATQRNAPLPNGLRIGGHRLEKMLAIGEFSIVYLARDEQERAVAIKEYLPSSLLVRRSGEFAPVISRANSAVFYEGLKRFFEEGRTLAKIEHQNVVRVLDFFRANDTVYLVMAYESGRSLREHILRCVEKKKHPLISERFLRGLFEQVLNGLRDVHAHKMLHLDLKPANIYLRRDNTPILLDFGASRQMLKREVLDEPQFSSGFAPPELYRKGDAVGPWSDIYSVGATMLSCMLGSRPQAANERQILDCIDVHFEKLNGQYSSQLLHLVHSCLMLDPMARPQSIYEMQKTLREPIAELPASVQPMPDGRLKATAGKLRAMFKAGGEPAK